MKREKVRVEDSIAGTNALPVFECRKTCPDFRGDVEREVANEWARMNVRVPMLSYGRVPVDSLCPIVKNEKGEDVYDAQAMRAINSTVQWFFGTSVGQAEARRLLEIESCIAQEQSAARKSTYPPLLKKK